MKTNNSFQLLGLASSYPKKTFLWATLILGTGVILGAFGAHALKNSPNIPIKFLETYETGIKYQFYHGISLFLLGILETLIGTNKKIVISKILFGLGVLLFCGNCYLYTLTQNKIFALIVPLGGFSFILGWIFLSYFFLQETFKRN